MLPGAPVRDDRSLERGSLRELGEVGHGEPAEDELQDVEVSLGPAREREAPTESDDVRIGR